MSSENPIERPAPTAPIRMLPSGRSVVVVAEGGTEAIEIRSPGGEMEIRIALTDQGPVLQLKGARLQIDSTDTVAVNCRDFEINASNQIKLSSSSDIEVKGQGEMKFKAAGSAWIDADFVNLNCLDRKGYHDYQPELPAPQEGEQPSPDGTTAE